MYTRKGNNWIKHLDFTLLDLLCLNLAFLVSFTLRFRSGSSGYEGTIYRNAVLLWSLLLLTVSALLDSYRNILRRNVYQELVSVLLMQSVAFAALIVALYAGHIGERFSRLTFFPTLLLSMGLSFAGHLLLKKLVLRRLRRKSADKQNARKVFVFTNSGGCGEILRNLNEDIFEVFSVEGVALLDAAGPDAAESAAEIPEGLQTFTDPDAAVKFICREWIDEVFFYLPGLSQIPETIVSACTEMGVTLHLMLELPETTREKQIVETLNGNTVLTVAYNYIAPHQALIKRLFDIFCGLFGSLFTLLLCVIIGPIIKIASPGPIFFKQKRIGKNGKQFDVYKFRSMYLDAEERKKELLKQNRVSDGMMFKLDFDPRVIGNRILPDGTKKTGIGEFIRKTSLDEFPQFFNVLKGDMSLVGTRPPTVDEWEKYEYHHRARLAVKPGITGMWQVSGRSKITDFEEVVRLDTKYILNYRLSLDLKILFKTVKVVFERKGAM